MFNIVLNKLTKEILRGGYCDFSNDGQLNPSEEKVVPIAEAKAEVFPKDFSLYRYSWDGSGYLKGELRSKSITDELSADKKSYLKLKTEFENATTLVQLKPVLNKIITLLAKRNQIE